MQPPRELLAHLGGDHDAEQLALVNPEEDLLRRVDSLTQMKEVRPSERDDIGCVQQLMDERVSLIELSYADSIRHDALREQRALHDGGVRRGLDLRQQPPLHIEVDADAEKDDPQVGALLLVQGALVQHEGGDLDRRLGVQLDARLVTTSDDAGAVGNEDDLRRAVTVMQLVVKGEQPAVVHVVADPEEDVPEELVVGRRAGSEMRPRRQPLDERWYRRRVLLVHPRELPLHEEVEAVGLSAAVIGRVRLAKIGAHVHAVAVLEEQP